MAATGDVASATRAGAPASRIIPTHRTKCKQNLKRETGWRVRGLQCPPSMRRHLLNVATVLSAMLLCATVGSCARSARTGFGVMRTSGGNGAVGTDWLMVYDRRIV